LARRKETRFGRDAFSMFLKQLMKAQGITLTPNVFKGIVSGLSERDTAADICTDAKANPEPDPELRDYENVPLGENIDQYFSREVLPHVPDAWIDRDKTKRGYEIPFTRHFYVYEPPRLLEEISRELNMLGADLQQLLQEVMA
jgi:type I restriction enzyme M protein